MVNIYSDTVHQRMERLATTTWSRDYEGTTNCLTSDILEILSYIRELEEKLGIQK